MKVSLVVGGEDLVYVLVRLSIFQRGGGPCPAQGTGAHLPHSFYGEQLIRGLTPGSCPKYLAMLRENSAEANTITEACLELSMTIFLFKQPFSRMDLKKIP